MSNEQSESLGDILLKALSEKKNNPNHAKDQERQMSFTKAKVTDLLKRAESCIALRARGAPPVGTICKANPEGFLIDSLLYVVVAHNTDPSLRLIYEGDLVMECDVAILATTGKMVVPQWTTSLALIPLSDEELNALPEVYEPKEADE